MAQWALKKGIDLLATGDWTHPFWLKELENNLDEGGKGIFQLKKHIINKNPRLKKIKFILSVEISSIYSQNGKLRRIHNLILVPSFAAVYKINHALKKRGCNLLSDGRPIIGLSSKELGELVWQEEERAVIIPCHIWTPWFSLYGSKSGFESLKECWQEYQKRIYAVETGLSSDPLMNWRIKELDDLAIVSFGDSHSPQKLGREMTIFKLKELSFSSLIEAFQLRKKKQTQNNQINENKILYTIEFYPEEGKYHYTGHRQCGISQSPEETKKKGIICPVCGKPLTLGVMHRVAQLASRESFKPLKKIDKKGLAFYYNPFDKTRPPYIMLVPLQEIIAEAFKTTANSIRVLNEYEKLVNYFGSEIIVLIEAEIEKIAQISNNRISEGIKKVRKGEIVIKPGYDGLFGEVKIWEESLSKEEKSKFGIEQASLF